MDYIIILIMIISPIILFLSMGAHLIDKYPALFDKIINYMED